MSTTFHLIRIPSGEEPETLGPYKHPAAQIAAARKIRDEGVDEERQLLYWLDITHGVPFVGAFDPHFYEGHDL